MEYVGRTSTEAKAPRPPRRGRPPSIENRNAVLKATRRLLVEHGYDDLTVEAIAAEAGLYRKYVNRTWESKAALVRDAIFDDAADFATPDLNDFTADVAVLVEQHVDLITRPEFLAGISGVQAALRTDPDLFSDTMARHALPPERAFARVLDAALQRGDIVAHLPARLVLNTVSGALQQLAHLGELTRTELIQHGTRLVTDGMTTSRREIAGELRPEGT